MEQKAQRFFQKEQIQPEDILYFVRHERKTILSLQNGSQRETYLPVKYLLAALPAHQFLNITKGVVISISGIRQIQGSLYTMVDGRQFEGRKRGAGEHKRNRHRLEAGSEHDPATRTLTIAQQCAVLDHSPIACCAIQILTDTTGHAVDLIFRYCNSAMLAWEGCSQEDLLDHAFHDVHRQWSHRFTSICTEVALQGISRTVTEYDSKHQCPVTIYCYQPMEHYCICFLIPDTLFTTI